MDIKEVRAECSEYVKNRLRATMQRIKKRQVKYHTTGTTGTGTGTGVGTNGTADGTDEQPLEEETAFNRHVNRSEEADTPPN